MPSGIMTLAADAPKLSSANTGFMLICSALVMIMTPGLAFFYGGMVRVKSTLNMLMMSFISLGIITILWVLYGFSVAFGASNGFFGGPGLSRTQRHRTDRVVARLHHPDLRLRGLPADVRDHHAGADQWCTGRPGEVHRLVALHRPVGHCRVLPGRALGLGLLTAGSSSRASSTSPVAPRFTSMPVRRRSVSILVIGKRVGFKRDPMRPHSLPLVMLGAALLWFGWFGFNAGSWLGNDDGVGAVMFVNTQVATAAAMLAWLAYEKIRHGSFTTLGAASGAVSGLVAITPSGGAVSPLGAIAVGAIAGVLCAMAVGLKYRFGFDDSLDVVGVHMVGGVIGSLLIGFFATGGVQSKVAGAFYGGGFHQLGIQAIGVFAVLGYSLVASAVLAFLIDKAIGMRVTEDVEVAGIDQEEHAETAYDFSGAGGGTRMAVPASSASAGTKNKRMDA